MLIFENGKIEFEKKKNKGRKKMKKPKLILGAVVVILIFSLLPGALAAKSTKLDFEAIGVETEWIPGDVWMEDGVMHMRFYKENDLSGTIDGIPFTGHTEENFHAKIDLATGNLVVNGKGTFYITWNGLEGSFYGPINAKIVSGELYGKFTLQGFEDFEGMKLFGIVWNIGPITNGINGTILVPN